MRQKEPNLRPSAERQVVYVFFALCCMTLAYAAYTGYAIYFADIHFNHPGVTQQEYYRLHNTIAVSSDHPLFRGEDFAPDQYRVGVVFAGKFIGDRLGMSKYYIVYAIFDFLCAMGVCLLCYQRLIASELFRRVVEPERRQAVLLILVALLYPFAWVIPWQRPETLPSALYLVFCIGCMAGGERHRWWAAAVFAATVWQSFVRTDVPLILGVSLVLLGCTAWGKRIAGSKIACIGMGAILVGIAAAVQVYLQAVRFPAAGYPPGASLMQFMVNVHPRQLIVFAIAMLPWAILMGLLIRLREVIEPADMLAATASCLYLPLWWAVGILIEVRLFVPFLLALTPTAAKLIVVFLRGNSKSVAPHVEIPQH